MSFPELETRAWDGMSEVSGVVILTQDVKALAEYMAMELEKGDPGLAYAVKKEDPEVSFRAYYGDLEDERMKVFYVWKELKKVSKL